MHDELSGSESGAGLRVFISYAREDEVLAHWVDRELSEAGASTTWMDVKSIQPGTDWRAAIRAGLYRADLIVVIVTLHSNESSREWIQFEQTEAMRLLKPIIPLKFVDCEYPPLLAQEYQGIDFTVDREGAMRRLLSAVRSRSLRRGRQLVDQTPASDGRFVGREEDLRAVYAMIRPDQHASTSARRVAIHGMPGEGKTMLAQELIRRLAPRYSGGVLEVQGGQAADPADRYLQLWAGYALSQVPRRSYTPADVRSLLSSYGALLVFFDDLSESYFGEAEKLLEALPPDATCIITTRSRNVRGRLGASLFSLSRLSEADARELWLDRMQVERESLLPRERSALERLVELVDGHALSLKLLAGRCDDSHDLPLLAEDLEQSLDRGAVEIELDTDELGSGSSVAQTLQIAFSSIESRDREKGTDWSRRFECLGVFPDGAVMDSALIFAVWGASDAGERTSRAALSGLYKRAMIQGVGEDRYRLHPLLRAFARGRLAEDGAHLDQVEMRYVRYVARQAAEGFARPKSEWRAFADGFLPHLRQVGEHLSNRSFGTLERFLELSAPEAPAGALSQEASAAGDVVEVAAEFAEATREYVRSRPETREAGAAWLRLGAACARVREDLQQEGTYLNALGRHLGRSQPPVAEPYFTEALRVAEESGDRSLQAAILSDHADVLRTQPAPERDRAVRLLDRALALAREGRDAKQEARALSRQGEIHWRAGRLDDALGCQQRALELYKGLNDQAGMGDVLNKIGSVYFNKGEHEEAIAYFEQSLEIHTRVGDLSMQAEDNNDMGIAWRYLGRVDEALPRLRTAQRLHMRVGNRRLEGLTTANIAAVHVDREEHERVLEVAAEALSIAREVSDPVTESWALNYRGLALQGQGKPRDALQAFESALDAARRSGAPRGIAGSLGNLGLLRCRFLGELESGLEDLREGLELLQREGLPQAFGGRRIEQFREAIEEFEQKLGGGPHG